MDPSRKRYIVGEHLKRPTTESIDSQPVAAEGSASQNTEQDENLIDLNDNADSSQSAEVAENGQKQSVKAEL